MPRAGGHGNLSHAETLIFPLWKDTGEEDIGMKKKDVIRQIGELDLPQGIPSSWFLHIRGKTGSINGNAIAILRHILDWHTPKAWINESGEPDIHAKFAGPRFNVTCKQLKDKSGLSVAQVRGCAGTTSTAIATTATRPASSGSTAR